MRAWADLDGDLDLEWAGAIYNDELRQSEAGCQADRGRVRVREHRPCPAVAAPN